MQLTTSLPPALTDMTKVIIDWSDFQTKVENSYADHDIDSLINYVKSHPRRSNIHVYLRSGARQPQSRALQRSLQTLGCTVIARTTLSKKPLPALTNFAHREYR